MHVLPAIYAAHAAFWLLFAAGDLAARLRARRTPAGPAPHRDANERAPMQAPHAGLLIAVHMVAFALMYMGIGRAVFGRATPATPFVVRATGALLIVAGGALAAWARLAFASWRFRARLDAGHRLATGGPFRFVRHPIYAALDLLALGTTLWVPTPLTILAAVTMVLGGELRARGEEPLLERAFGDEYLAYRRRTRRFVPGLY